MLESNIFLANHMGGCMTSHMRREKSAIKWCKMLCKLMQTHTNAFINSFIVLCTPNLYNCLDDVIASAEKLILLAYM